MKAEALQGLLGQLDGCSACPLRKECQAPVGWFGDPDSPIMFVGEGPGGDEDDYGCPLIGRSGQLLDKALWSVQITRDRVLTTNVIKCRPRGNRTPNLAEADFCAQRWLDKEIDIVKPLVIVALGGVAMHYLGNADMRITKQRGQWFKTKQGIDCIATFHPAYLLRKEGHELVAAKWDVFHDLEAARDKVLAARPAAKLGSDKPVDLFSLYNKRSH